MFTKVNSIDRLIIISFTMIENNKGPSTVPWGTPLLTLRKLVTTPSTTTLCRRSHRKLIIQFLMYGLMSYDANLLNRMRWETESKALLKSNEKALTKAASRSSRSSQKCWHLIRAIVVLCPFLYANWSGPIADMRMGDNSMEEIHAMQVELIFDIIFIVHQIWHLPAHSLSPLQHGKYPNYQTTFHMRGESSSKP